MLFQHLFDALSTDADSFIREAHRPISQWFNATLNKVSGSSVPFARSISSSRWFLTSFLRARLDGQIPSD